MPPQQSLQHSRRTIAPPDRILAPLWNASAALAAMRGQKIARSSKSAMATRSPVPTPDHAFAHQAERANEQ